MALKLTRMHVYLAPQNGGQDPEEYDVEIRHVDRPYSPGSSKPPSGDPAPRPKP